MNILLVGHGGSCNRGCEAIVRSTIDILNRHVESAKITILSADAKSDRKAGLSCFDNVQLSEVVTSKTKKYSPYWFADRIERRVVRRLMPGVPPVNSVVNSHFYRKADIVINVGGDNFTDDYSTGASEFFGELSLARAFKCMI